MGSNESRKFVNLVLSTLISLCHCFNFWWPSPIIEGLQSELESANKEGECVRKRLKFQDDQLERIKETTELSAADEQNKYGKRFQNATKNSDDFNNMCLAENLVAQNAETTAKLIRMQSLASELNMQLVQASGDVERLRQERDEILDKLSAQEKLLRVSP